MRRAVSHGVGCEYPQYPAGVTASVLSTHSAVEYRRLLPWGGRCREPCAAWGVQAKYLGGLVRIDNDGTGNVSVVGSTLTNIAVRAHCRVPSRVPAHRGSRPAAPHR
jgi:hypothetical protein